MASFAAQPVLAQRAATRVASRRVSTVVRASSQVTPKVDRKTGARAALLALGTGALVQQAQAARAEDAVDGAVASVTEVVKATGSAVKAGLDIFGAGVKVLQEGYQVAAPVIKQGVDAVTPVVQEAVKVTTEAAAPVVQRTAPVVTDTLQSALRSTGVDFGTLKSTTGTLAKTAEEGAAVATPFVTKVANFLTTAEPTTLAELGVGAVALYYLGPGLLGAAFGSLRGFAGEISAAQALDTLSEGNTVLIDIRTEGEKENSGLPDAPSSAGGKVIEVEYASIADKKLRGSLKDPGFLEAQVTALQIAALKRLNRGSKILLLDRYGNTSKIIAKELARRGFNRCYVVAGGFDGRGGWVQSKLLVKPTAGMYSGAEPIGSKFARTLSTRTSGRKALPAPSK